MIKLYHKFCEQNCIYKGTRRFSPKTSMQIEAQLNITKPGYSNRKKDYWDIHEPMTKFSLTQMLDYASNRYPYSFNRENVVKKL